MKNLEEFLEEGKKITIKRKYTENHPASTVGKTASVRNEVLKAVKDGVITEEEFSKIISKVSASPNRWRNTNSKYFNVSEDGIKLSKWGLRILSELDLPTLRAFPICEATVVMDAMDPKSKTLKKLLKKHKVTMEILDPSGPSGWPEVELTGSREDLQSVLADPNGWDDPELGEYIEESVVNEALSKEQKMVETFLNKIAKEFDYSIQDAVRFVKETISKMGLDESVVNEGNGQTVKEFGDLLALLLDEDSGMDIERAILAMDPKKARVLEKQISTLYKRLFDLTNDGFNLREDNIYRFR